MKIVELCGNPGCGKTTISKQLVSELMEKQYKVFDYNDIKPKKYIYNIKYIRSFKSIRAIKKLYKYGKNSDFKKRLVYSVKCIVIINQLAYWESIENIDFIVFDEGIIQYLSTLSHEVEIDDRRLQLVDCVKEIYQNEKYYLVDCRVSLDENIKRIQGRNRIGDRFVSDEFKRQVELLTLKRNNLSTLIQFINPQRLIEIDMQEDVEQLTNDLMTSL